MFAKSSWFQKRKYGGWGLTPKTWQGWVYIFVFIVALLVFQAMPFWNDATRTAFTVVWAIVLGGDALRIMVTLQRDEMEKMHEAIAERNASWAMVAVLTIGILYEIISSGLRDEFYLNPFLAIALIAGLAAKGLSYFFLEKK
jgi:hypothetical protein